MAGAAGLPDGFRADRELVKAYAALKRELAAQHMADREACTAANSDFLRAVLERTAKHGKTTGNGTP